MRFWTIRHPPVDRKGRCIGQTAVETTMSVAEAIKVVQANAPIQPDRIFSSDLPRCSELAKGLAVYWSCPIILVPEIREMHFGEWEGRSYDDLYREDGERWQQWCNNWQTQAPPSGESMEQFTQRVKGWLDDQTFDLPTLLVTHAGVRRVLQVLAGDSWERAMNTEHPYLSWKSHTIVL